MTDSTIASRRAVVVNTRPGMDNVDTSSTGTSSMKSDSVTNAISCTSGLANSLADR